MIKGGKVEVTIHGHLEILEYCSQSLINEEESFNDNYYVTYGWSGFDSIEVGTETIKKIDSYLVRKAYFAELFKADGPHPLPVDARWRDEENVEATYIIELADDEEFDIDKIEFVEADDAPEVFEDCRFIADHILYDGKEIVTDSLSDYSAEDMFNSPGWKGEINEI